MGLDFRRDAGVRCLRSLSRIQRNSPAFLANFHAEKVTRVGLLNVLHDLQVSFLGI